MPSFRSNSNSRQLLQTRAFSSSVYRYGMFFDGSRWQIFGCVTFKKRCTRDTAVKTFKKIHRILEKQLQSQLAYIAVPEKTTSGIGLPKGPWHLHFVMAGPPQLALELGRLIEKLWRNMYGDVDVRLYREHAGGCFYLAKTAGLIDFEWFSDRLERMTSTCPDDLFVAQQHDPHVPEHVRHALTFQTLRILDPDSSMTPAHSEFADSLEKEEKRWAA